MKCEVCRRLLKELVLGQLDDIDSETQEHLLECAFCSSYAERLVQEIDIYLEDAEPSDPELLWQKIYRSIEKDSKARTSLWARFWTFSFGQVVAGILVVSLLSSVLTILAIEKVFSHKRDFQDFEPNFIERILTSIGFAEVSQKKRRIKEQQEAIEYWSQKVQKRRHQWDDKIKEVFDRNLEEIEKAVAEYKKNLEENPYDDISVEMLDSAMKEKLELLREFAEL